MTWIELLSKVAELTEGVTRLYLWLDFTSNIVNWVGGIALSSVLATLIFMVARVVTGHER